MRKFKSSKLIEKYPKETIGNNSRFIVDEICIDHIDINVLRKIFNKKVDYEFCDLEPIGIEEYRQLNKYLDQELDLDLFDYFVIERTIYVNEFD